MKQCLITKRFDAETDTEMISDISAFVKLCLGATVEFIAPGEDPYNSKDKTYARIHCDRKHYAAISTFLIEYYNPEKKFLTFF